jgi:hypothetical protein
MLTIYAQPRSGRRGGRQAMRQALSFVDTGGGIGGLAAAYVQELFDR